MCRGLWELGEFALVAAASGGMDFSNIRAHGNGMADVWIIFILEWPVLMLAAWYLEQVLNSGTGVRRHWLFPFKRRATQPKCASRVRVDDLFTCLLQQRFCTRKRSHVSAALRCSRARLLVH